MSQNALVLPTTGVVSGLSMTQATNNALDTLNTLASGTSAPSSPQAGQFWHDTTNNLIKLRSLDNTTWIPFLQLNEGSYAALPYLASQLTGDVNRVINSGVTIDQVNEGASYSIPNNNAPGYTADQYVVACLCSSASGITAQRVADAPAGFTNSLKLTVGTGASSVGATDFLYMYQPIEGNMLSDLNYGTANAVTMSLSFWVKSSVAGTFAAVLQNAAGNRAIVNKFTIASPGAWQLVILPNIPGDQSGTWASGAAAMLNLFIVVAVGTTNQTSTLNAWQGGDYLGSTTQTNSVLTTSGASFQVTGVMFNAGPFCLPYEKRLVGQELQLCERYFEKSFPVGTAVAQAAGAPGAFSFIPASVSFGCSVNFRTIKRASATITTYNPAASNANWRDPGNSADRTFIGGAPSDKQFQCYGSSGATNASTIIHYTANARL